MPDEIDVDDCLHLIRFLAQAVVGAHTCRAEAISLSPDKCKEYLILKYPVVQGMSNFNVLEKLSRQPFDSKSVFCVAEALLQRE